MVFGIFVCILCGSICLCHGLSGIRKRKCQIAISGSEDIIGQRNSEIVTLNGHSAFFAGIIYLTVSIVFFVAAVVVILLHLFELI